MFADGFFHYYINYSLYFIILQIFIIYQFSEKFSIVNFIYLNYLRIDNEIYNIISFYNYLSAQISSQNFSFFFY